MVNINLVKVKQLILIIALWTGPILVNAQNLCLDAFKYVYVPTLSYNNGNSYDIWGISRNFREYFSGLGMEVIVENDPKLEKIDDLCQILNLSITHTNVLPPAQGYNYIYVKMYTCNGKVIGDYSAGAARLNVQGDFNAASRKIFNKITNSLHSFTVSGFKYTFNPELTPEYESNVEKYTGEEVNFESEKTIREYLDKKPLDNFEGIWKTKSDRNTPGYKILLLKNDIQLVGYIIDKEGFWKPGDKKLVLETTAISSIADFKYVMGDMKTTVNGIAELKPALISMEFNMQGETNKILLYKVYPSLETTSNRPVNSGNWTGNGSGIIISNEGHILTNHHVIENAKEIEIELKSMGNTKHYKCETILTDKINDLALIKIIDDNYKPIKLIPFNFKREISDVGTSVYAFGYPMALSIMGKEIKVTDGIISAKSGFNGDITTYQITAPIQPGNSGGPLFDSKMNLIGINSSGINKKIAENVGYAIKSSYAQNLVESAPSKINLPHNKSLSALPLTQQIKKISPFVVLVKTK